MVIRIDLEGAVEQFWRKVLMRLHLAEAVLSLWAYVMQEEFLNGVFDKHRGRSYQDVITFPRLVELIEKHNADTIVLARYMQILPEWVCERYPNRILNIHHSFLPSFVGARPYHQASTRGVKLIGATCHYVTADLDEGPIIDQDVVRVSHSDTVQDLVRLGKDVEKVVLARGLRDHVEDRVMVHGNKTIVFK